MGLEHLVGLAAQDQVAILAVQPHHGTGHDVVPVVDGPTAKSETSGGIFFGSARRLDDTIERLHCGHYKFSHLKLLLLERIVGRLSPVHFYDEFRNSHSTTATGIFCHRRSNRSAGSAQEDAGSSVATPFEHLLADASNFAPLERRVSRVGNFVTR
jgi:hypothetical protein